MPIKPPALDDRSYEDLVAELLARIPAHTPEWTHPRPGDPGRTLIELFAWLGDTLLYRANLIPERQRLAWLRLLGLAMKPARAATGLVALQVKSDKQPAAVQVPAGALIDKPLPFSTLQHCTAYPVVGRAFVRRRLDADEQRDFNALLPDLQAVYRGLEGQPQGYVTAEVFAPGQDLAPGVDLMTATVDGALWLALMAPGAAQHAQARQTLAPDAQGLARALNIGLALAPTLPEDGQGLGTRQPLPLIWEMSGPAGALTALEMLEDGTQGLSRSGVLRLALPPLSRIGAPSNDPRENLLAGVGADAPPRLDSEADAARLIAWLRLRVAADFPLASLRLAWAGLHAVEVEQRQALADRVLGVSDGGSDQRFELGLGAQDGAEPEALQCRVHDTVLGSRLWQQVDDLGRAGPLDEVYRFDAEAGSLRFGDGIQGRVPSTGSRIVAAGLRVGGGARGNLPAGTLSKLASVSDLLSGARRVPLPAIDVRQPLALRGGADAETLDAAERRIPAHFQHRDRVVTAEDYRLLAREAPGAAVGRVEVLPRFKPHERQSGVPGAVSVMVLPQRDSEDQGAPLPRADRPLLEAVHGFLNERRPLATELYVIGCEYRAIGLAVAVQIRAGYAREVVLAEVRQALRRYLWPLPLDASPWPATPGQDGGYPLGRRLGDRELEVVVARISGVVGVSPLRLFEQGANGGFTELPGAGKIPTTLLLQPWQLPELVALAVIEGVDAPTSPELPHSPSSAAAALFLPVVPELC